MHLVVITGMSGAGKSQALNMLEDMDYYCIDNMPPLLMEEFVNLYDTHEGRKTSNIAIGVITSYSIHYTKLYDCAGLYVSHYIAFFVNSIFYPTRS